MELAGVAAIAGDREERELITRVLFAPLHDCAEVLRTFERLKQSAVTDYRTGDRM